MKIQKKHILVSALVLALGAAVYINWQFSGSPSAASASKELGAVTYVSKTTAATADEAVSASSASSPKEKLAKARTERSQAQDKALDEAKEIIKLSESSDEAKEKAVEIAGELEKRFTAQSNIENILRAKGFSDCVCYVSDSGCTITVMNSELEKSSPMIIKDVVMSQLDIEFSNIVIVGV